MNSSALPPPLLVADNTALDFLNSICAPAQEEIEWLPDGAALIAWMRAAGLLREDEELALRENVSPESLNLAAQEARALREWFRGVILQRAGAEQTGALEEAATLNPVLALGAQFSEIDKTGVLQRRLPLTSAQELLALLGAEMARALVELDFKHVKNCEGPTCPLWFVDLTKNKRRRWCSMSICGNRAKVASYRRRQKDGGEG